MFVSTSAAHGSIHTPMINIIGYVYDTHRGAGDHEGHGGAASYMRPISGVVAGGTPLP